jgi:hypothetical protein
MMFRVQRTCASTVCPAGATFHVAPSGVYHILVDPLSALVWDPLLSPDIIGPLGPISRCSSVFTLFWRFGLGTSSRILLSNGRFNLVYRLVHIVPYSFLASRELIHLCRVKRGVSTHHPSKQPLNDADIERIKEIAHIELEDARTELERADAVAQSMGQRDQDGGGDDYDEDESAWVECVSTTCVMDDQN